MKKRIWVLIAGILVLFLTALIYYNYAYPYSGNAGEITEQELRCGAYYGDYNQKKIGTPDGWVLSSRGTKSALWHAPENWTHPLSCDEENPPLIGGCAGVQEIYQAECCENWASENNISHIMCAGKWQYNYDKESPGCRWMCYQPD
jgi:hypothetical protein